MRYWRSNSIAFYTILHKEMTRFTRIWMQTLLPSAVTTALYFMIFGDLIGSRIGDMDGIGYAEYIAPGLIMLAVITNAYSNVASSFFSVKFQRSIEELMVAPVSDLLILLGYTAGGVARGLATAIIVTAVALFFTEVRIAHVWVVLLVMLLTAILFSQAGFLNAMFAKRFDDVSIVPTFVLTPLTYLGGVFYSISLLPDVWQGVSLFNPILYMVNAFRYGMLGVSDIPIGYAFCIILAFTVILFAINLYLLRRGIGIRT